MGQEKQKQPRKIKTQPGSATANDCANACIVAAMWRYKIMNFWNLFCFALPRGDVKPLARNLLAQFGDLSGVLSATEAWLLEVNGIGQEVISEFRLIEAVALNFGQSRIMHKPALANWNQMISYCRTKIAEKNKEEFHVLFLDKKNHIIADEMTGSGTVDHAPV